MKVLVTGATGGIGSHIVDRLLELDHEVITCSRSAAVSSSFSWRGRTTHLPFTIGRDRNNDLFNYFQRPEAVIHLAWSDLDNYYADSHLETQLPAHMLFLKGLVVRGGKNITVAGTCFEYGLREGALHEGLKTAPVLPYGAAKDTLRKFLVFLQREYAFGLKWLRYFYILENQNGRPSLFSMLEQAVRNGVEVFNMSGGEQLRDYLKINQVVDYTVALALQDKNPGIINVSSGNPVSIRCMVEKGLRELGGVIQLNLGYYPYLDYEPMAFWGDDSKLVKLLKDNG